MLYEYPILDQLIPLENAAITTKYPIQLLCYHIDNTIKYPFLQFLLQKNEAENELILPQLILTSLLNIHQQISEYLCDDITNKEHFFHLEQDAVKGILPKSRSDKTNILVVDVSSLFKQREKPLFIPITISEIVNLQKTFIPTSSIDFEQETSNVRYNSTPVSSAIYRLFTQECPKLLVLVDTNKQSIEIPEVIFDTTEQKWKSALILGNQTAFYYTLSSVRDITQAVGELYKYVYFPQRYITNKDGQIQTIQDIDYYLTKYDTIYFNNKVVIKHYHSMKQI